MENRKKFYYFTQLIGFNKQGQFKPTECADITFVNIGTTVVSINQVPLNLGDSMVDEAFGDEVNETQYNIQFADQIDCRLIIKQKVYQS